MNIVIDKELLFEYFKLLKPGSKNEKENFLLGTIHHNKNKFKISSNYLKVLENYFKDKGIGYENIFQSFITNYYQEKRIISFTTSNTKSNEEDELINAYDYDLKDFCFCLIKSKRIRIIESIPNGLSIYDDIKKPNINWTILGLSSRTLLSLDYSNFKSNDEISSFFLSISKLPRIDRTVHIVDSYFNVNTFNSVYLPFKNSTKVKCYTKLENNNSKELNRNTIKSFFGKSKTTVFFSTNKRITHDRKIKLGYLIIELTHDPGEVTQNNLNWTIYFSICEEKTKLFIDKTSNYK
ncbi:hypothetical protein KZP23_14665 [Echinicola marina]|uniref:hypothetical protein n=1 Tax=Echinicola marina TaxID=2859768 RepID=UPI001CF659D3|nr:hypothetical protein [Echinicola marina]UCS91962.1 hypothetical protein KZP23_14665 [Echinicola marina]